MHTVLYSRFQPPMALGEIPLRPRSWAFALWLSLQLAIPGAFLHAAENGQSTVDERQESLLPQPVTVSDDDVTVVGLEEYPDPLEPVNRAFFVFNDVVFTYIAAPAGNVYQVLPDGVRSSVSRFFLNLQEPLYLINNTAQGRLSDAGKNLLRFVSNTVIGLGGLFDPATHWFDIAPAPARFDDTFARYNMGGGAYLVMPFFGPTNVRGGVASVLDSTFHPVRWVTHEPETTWIIVFDHFQRVAPQLDNYVELRNEAEDPYVYFRNQYMQNSARDARFPAAGQDSVDE